MTVETTDVVDRAPQTRVFTVTANEPVDSPGSGNSEYGWQLLEPLLVELRAERSGQGTDRIYTLFVGAVDASGNRSISSIQVLVPHEHPGGGDGTVIPSPGRRRSAGH